MKMNQLRAVGWCFLSCREILLLVFLTLTMIAFLAVPVHSFLPSHSHLKIGHTFSSLHSLPFLFHPSNSLILTTRSTTRSTTPASSSSTTTTTCIYASDQDSMYLEQAVSCAKQGLGHTFPNPAVGCVLVDESNSNNNGIIGKGFHPRAGYPHAEIFALLEAMKHVPDGIQAAQTVLLQSTLNNKDDTTIQETSSSSSPDIMSFKQIQQLTQQYRNDPTSLFTPFPDTMSVTAYVTLEPCCHYGQTPPCALALQLANVKRVVVGYRDPNPRVNGGGVQFLQQHGITVDILEHPSCATLVSSFVKRITPRPDIWPMDTYNDQMTGAMRSILRSVAGRSKATGTLAEVSWANDMYLDPELLLLLQQQQQQQQQQQSSSKEDNNNNNNLKKMIQIKPEWMEHLDQLLWDHEIVQVRLNNVVKKKKDAKLIGQIIAEQLQAHVAQTLGHTCLFYRPAIPPILNWESLLEESSTTSTSSQSSEN